VPGGEQQGGGVELSVTEKAWTLLEDGCTRVSVAHDIAVASRQRHDEARHDATFVEEDDASRAQDNGQSTGRWGSWPSR